MTGVEQAEAAHHVWLRARAAGGHEPDDVRIERVRAKHSDPSAVLIVVERCAQVVGMAVAEPFREPLGRRELRPGWGHVSMVFVDPDFQGVGVGREVIKRLFAATSWPTLSLWTKESNVRAQRLYRRCGFAATGDRGRLVGGEPIRRWQFPHDDDLARRR